MVVIVWYLDLQLTVQSVPTCINTKVVSLNPVHGKVYLIRHYVIKFVSHFLQVGRFSPVSSTDKTDSHDIIEILLKVALNTIKPPTKSNHLIFLGMHFIKDIFLRPFLMNSDLQCLYLAESDITDGTLFRLSARKMDKVAINMVLSALIFFYF